MKNCIWKITKSLCAVFLMCAILVGSLPWAVSADENSETSAEQTETIAEPTKNYVYHVTFEFGYFSFYYDWGVWDTQDFVYKASESSNNPAAEVTPVLDDEENTLYYPPGWYGFDGINNRIYLKNYSPNAEQDVVVTIHLDTTQDIDGTDFPVDNVQMSCYEVAPDGVVLGDWSVPNTVYYEDDTLIIEEKTLQLMAMPATTLSSGERAYQVKLESGHSKAEEATVYISLSGEPYVRDSDEDTFIGITMTKIGFLTVAVSLASSEEN